MSRGETLLASLLMRMYSTEGQTVLRSSRTWMKAMYLLEQAVVAVSQLRLQNYLRIAQDVVVSISHGPSSFVLQCSCQPSVRKQWYDGTCFVL